MPSELDHTHDRPLTPPDPEPEQGLWRWLVAAVLVLIIVVGSYRAYDWLVTDVERRRAGTEAPPPPTEPVAQTPGADTPAAAAPGRTIRTPQPSPPVEAVAPAVTGQAIHKCIIDGQVSYSNQPCPEGATSTPVVAAGEDPNGVAGSAGDSVPALVARPTSLGVGDPSHQVAACAYLVAEITRLDFEFQQPLPPNVLDHISTRLTTLRAEHQGAKCGPLPKTEASTQAAPAARKRTEQKVVDEKPGD
ncbi:MAG: hypothetical protein Q4G70_14975 [Pseudomonadota bacterium]|nr:hypothetical protein [Pseudomonadota bacterium]